MAEYQKSQFDRCFFNPLEKDLSKTYPKLAELIPAEFGQDDALANEGDKLLRYILALYDPKSPIVKDNPDLGSRKIAAAHLAGYNTGRETDKLELIYTCESEFMVGVIVNFMRQIVQSRVWASLQADEQTYWEFIYRMLLPINRDKGDKDQVQAVAVKTKLSEDKESIMARIDNSWNKFIGEDDDLRKKIKKIDYSPESMAGIK